MIPERIIFVSQGITVHIDLPLNIQGAKLILYADDTNVLVADRNEEALQIRLSSVMEQWKIGFLKMIFL